MSIDTKYSSPKILPLSPSLLTTATTQPPAACTQKHTHALITYGKGFSKDIYSTVSAATNTKHMESKEYDVRPGVKMLVEQKSYMQALIKGHNRLHLLIAMQQSLMTGRVTPSGGFFNLCVSFFSQCR